MRLSDKLGFNRLPAFFWGYIFVISAIVMPWVIRPGYLFFTDMAWGANIKLDWTDSWFLFNLLIKGLSFVIPVDFLEKIFVIFSLALILLGGRIFVKTVLEYYNGFKPTVIGSRWLVFAISLFALFNPFVYDRALYGQFGILAAYGCLLFVVAYLFKAWQTLDFKNLLRAAALSAVALLFSVHFVFFLAPFYLLFLIVIFLERKEIRVKEGFKNFRFNLLLSISIVLALNANWLVAMFFGASSLTNFVGQGITNQDLSAFQTVGRTPIETFSNVLLMSGFWGKEQFRYLDLTDMPGWQRSFIFLVPLVSYGVYCSFRRRSRQEKILSAGLMITFILAVFLAVGIKSSFFGGLSLFLYDHFPLYKGLREPQKWVAVIVPIYLFYLTLGVSRLQGYGLIKKNRCLSIVVLAAIIIMQAPSLLWGFNRQVKSTSYPLDWYEIDNFLVNRAPQSYGCSDKVLFLPWHMYMYFGWAGKIIVNPASTFFACPVLVGTNMEYGGIYSNSSDFSSQEINAWVSTGGHSGVPKISGSALRYIILAKEVDCGKYSWLDSLPYLELIKETETLLVYEIKS